MQTLKQLDEALDQIVEAAFAAQPPSGLFHYTSWEAFANIVRTQQFRLTAHDCTGDSAELASADELIANVVNDLRAQLTGDAATFLQLVQDNYDSMKVTRFSPVYLACFSEDRDASELWTRFGGCSEGVCIGIRVLAEEGPESHPIGLSLLRVSYGTSVQARVRDAFLTICDSYNRFLATCDEADELEAQHRALGGLYRVAAFAAIATKKSPFEVEHEWRQVGLVRSGEQAPPEIVGGKRVQHLSLRSNGKLLAFSDIILGRRLEREEGDVRKLLEEAGYPTEDAPLPAIYRSAV
jgi:hypothetical protein